MKILLLASHAVAEYDDIRMFHDLGHEVFAPGGYEHPGAPAEKLRPALPQVPEYPELVAFCEAQRTLHAEEGTEFAIDWAKMDLHPELIEWADVIICHHFPERWIGGQWGRIKHKRVIWRTCGQSNPQLEHLMSRFPGLEIVRYSLREQPAFIAEGAFAGQAAVIRFGKYPADYGPWTGGIDKIASLNQWGENLGRADALNLAWYRAATRQLACMPAGPGSEALPGGVGKLDYGQILDYLRMCRVFAYTGTRPASYTLGLIEAGMSGIPIVGIDPFSWGWPELFEAHEFYYASTPGVVEARFTFSKLLADNVTAQKASEWQRSMMEHYFGIERIGPRWQQYLATGHVDPEPPVDRRTPWESTVKA